LIFHHCRFVFQSRKTTGSTTKENNMTCNFKIFAYPACGLALSLLLSAPAVAQNGAKTLAENNKAIVTDNTLAAGATATPVAQTGPFVTRYYLSSATLEYTYADGKKEMVTRKAGTALIILATDKRPASVKNISTTALHYISVAVK